MSKVFTVKRLVTRRKTALKIIGILRMYEGGEGVYKRNDNGQITK